jgi:hypothetical protein
VVVVRRGLASILAAAALACGGGAHTPGATALRYLEALGSDPIRTLELVTPGFHDRHGLRFEEVADRPFADPQARSTPSGDAALERERARLGWLTVLTKPIFALQGGRFGRRVVSERIRADHADVVVERPGHPPFDARIQLRRIAADAPWRIDAVLLPEVGDAQLVQAFLVAPDAELHRRIAEARERRLR